MAFLTRVAVLADLAEMHDAAFKHRKMDDKGKALLKQIEQVVAAGKIDANLKESFKKFVTKEVSHLSEIRKYQHIFDQMCRTVREYDPTVRQIIFETPAKDAALSAKKLKEFDWDKFSAWAKQRGFPDMEVRQAKSFVDSWPTIFSYYAALNTMRDKVNALATEGEVVKKEKKDIGVSIPTSKYFKNFDFLKYYTPKMQQAIVDAVPEIEHAIELGEATGASVRRWDAIFNKHDKVNSFLGEHFYNLHIRLADPRTSARVDQGKLEIVNKDFAPVRAVFKKIDELEILSSKEREKRESIQRDWSPGADILKKRLHEIISAVIEKWKKNDRESCEERLKNEWDSLAERKIKTVKEFKEWVEKQDPKERRFITWPNRLFMAGDKFVANYPEEAVVEFAKKEAETAGNDVARTFVSKNLDKLVSLLKQKKLKDIKVSGLQVSYPTIESRMHFTFEGGSSFMVVNKFVQVESRRGTVFWRYPTTFHDVKVNGKPMATPSEYKVYMEFSGEAPPKEEKEEEAKAQVSFRKQVRSKYRY